MSWRIGLTDYPEREVIEHGAPLDWQTRTFESEEEAREWYGRYSGKLGYVDSANDSGWHYGYWYMISPSTSATQREEQHL